MSKLTVCVCGAGNAAHAFIALFASQGCDVTVFSDFGDESERLQAALAASGGITVHDRSNPSELKTFKGAPILVSKNAADVVPQADVIVDALPSFAQRNIFESVRSHLKEGAVIFVMPGQGGVDFLARDILSHTIQNKNVIVAGVMPMPFNCRIIKFGESVDLAAFKDSYDLATVPADTSKHAADILSAMLHKEVRPLDNFIAMHLWPANPNIHPGRLYGLFHDYEVGKVYDRNPLFYEEFDDISIEWCQKINDERLAVWRAVVEKSEGASGKVADVPELKAYLERTYAGQIHDSSSLLGVLAKNDGFKGFRCPMKEVEGGWVPDFKNRYFTEDIPCTVAIYKGIADMAGVPTPSIDHVMTFFQRFMGKEYVKSGSLSGADRKETMAPQSFGINTLCDFGLCARIFTGCNSLSSGEALARAASFRASVGGGQFHVCARPSVGACRTQVRGLLSVAGVLGVRCPGRGGVLARTMMLFGRGWSRAQL